MSAYRRLRRALSPVRRAVDEYRYPCLRRDRVDGENLARLLAWTLREDSCCVDVGAHAGTILAHMVRLAPRGRHHAFEPLPDYAATLRLGYPGVEVHEAAVSDEAGRSTFVHVLDVPAMSGLRRRGIDGPVRTENIQVETVRLDDVLPGDYVPSLIKIDVEGAELGVLTGAVGTIRRHRPVVVFEHGKGAADVYDSAPADIHTFFADLGMRIMDLDGGGPYTAGQFEEEFRRNERWNWVAH